MSFLPAISGTGIGALLFLNRTREQQESVLSQTGGVSRDLEAVRSRLTNIQNVDDLLGDRQVLRVVLGSVGLQDDINNTGFLRSILMSDLNDERSAANRIADPKYRELAQMFNFSAGTGANLPGSSAADTLTPQLQALSSVDALFERSNSRLLTRALEVFDLEDDAGRTTFLQRVLNSDLSDETSLVNRLGDERYIAFASAFQSEADNLPEQFRGKVSDKIAETLRNAKSGEDITSDRRVLNAVLSQFGLEDQINNTTLITSVLNSDLADPNAIANRIGIGPFQDLARAFDFVGRRDERTSVYALAELARRSPESLVSADSFLENDELLSTALAVFGLEADSLDKDRLRSVLTADPNDEASAINEPENARYAALSLALGFGEQLARPNPSQPSRLDRLVEAVERRNGLATTVDAVVGDPRFLTATLAFFDLPQGTNSARYAERLLSSDPSSPISTYQLARDPNFRNFYDALNIQSDDEVYTYPAGFTDAVINSYIERQFEISVGEVDADMRLMLSLERDLGAVFTQISGNDGRWFRVIGTPSLRSVFEGALGLPDSIGQLDIDRQLSIFKDKSQQVFGTDDLAEIAAPGNLEGVQRRYLAFSSINQTTSINPAASVLSLLL